MKTFTSGKHNYHSIFHNNCKAADDDHGMLLLTEIKLDKGANR